ncbi:CBU_0592 family membrane protein [Sphingobium subterraneum]|uniref:CBU-0592-like domain-containing protein n=1 Tax=Sphingobium subterraneum TaxID=627688 RepID=A0A841IYM3_9SPHN|nr:hypothetical protein [Sphingobium subterraneum]MBB6122376.1 hypothetical protein [Sphingobium subterraneum]
MNFAMEAIGWMGAVLVLGAYALLSTGRVQGDSRLYQWMNLIGSAGFIANTAWHGAIPSVVLNIIWCGIGIATLWRIRRR